MRKASRWPRSSVLAELWPGKVCTYSTSMRVTASQPFCIQSFQNIITWAHFGGFSSTNTGKFIVHHILGWSEGDRKSILTKNLHFSGWTGTKRNHFAFMLIAVTASLTEKLGPGALSSAWWEQGFLEDVTTKMNLKMCVSRCPKRRKKAFYNKGTKMQSNAVYLSPTDDSAYESTAKEKKEKSKKKVAVKLQWQEEVGSQSLVLSKALDLVPRRLWRDRKALSREWQSQTLVLPGILILTELFILVFGLGNICISGLS